MLDVRLRRFALTEAVLANRRRRRARSLARVALSLARVLPLVMDERRLRAAVLARTRMLRASLARELAAYASLNALVARFLPLSAREEASVAAFERVARYERASRILPFT